MIGGASSGISVKTKNIFVESACFAPNFVRQSSKKFNIETDSAYRFSRGVAPETALPVLRMAVDSIQRIAGGQICQNEHNITEKRPKAEAILIQKKDLKRRLGMEVSFKDFQDRMKKLGCIIPTEKGLDQAETAKLIPPFFRFDISLKEDLIEEYARLQGYDKIPEKPTRLGSFPKPDHKEYTLSSKTADVLVHQGFYQAINHSFISREFFSDFLNPAGRDAASSTANAQSDKSNTLAGLWPAMDIKPVFIKNPLSAEYNMMRLSLMPSLFKNARQSIRHGRLKGRLFELGRVFTHNNKGGDIPYKEEPRLALASWGQEENLWEKSQNRLCVYDLKSALNALLESFCISDYQWKQAETNNASAKDDLKTPAFIHPYQYMVLKLRGEILAFAGSLHPMHAEKHKIRVDMALAELNMRLLFDHNLIEKDFKAPSLFPLVERDLAFLIPKDFPAGCLIPEIKKQAGFVCREVKIFDIYENEKSLAKGLRSVAFRLTLQSDKKTLTEEQLQGLQKKLTKQLTSRFPIKLRSESPK